jgi:hypothetical protein
MRTHETARSSDDVYSLRQSERATYPASGRPRPVQRADDEAGPGIRPSTGWLVGFQTYPVSL